MIQDIAPHHYHNEYHHFEIQKGDCVLFYRKREVLLAYDDEQIVYPKYEEISKKEARQYSYLFRIDDCRYFLCGEIDETLLDLYHFESIQRMRKAQPKYQAFAGVTGLQLVQKPEILRMLWRCNGSLDRRADDAVPGMWPYGVSEDFTGCHHWFNS